VEEERFTLVFRLREFRQFPDCRQFAHADHLAKALLHCGYPSPLGCHTHEPRSHRAVPTRISPPARANRVPSQSRCKAPLESSPGQALAPLAYFAAPSPDLALARTGTNLATTGFSDGC